MHDSAFRIGELVMRTYCDLPNAKVLEVGSLNVNGCLRDAAAPSTSYVGLDLEEGPSVDFVITPGADFPVSENSFDLVMASSVFEHDVRFWDTFVRMCRAARVGGHIYVNAPSNGTVHRYPMDCWRFYPDAGLALAEYARSEGLELDLVESFVANRHSDVWNDFVAIFRKGPTDEPLNTAFVYYRYPSANARTWQSRAVYKESDATEDMSIIAELRSERDGLINDAHAHPFNEERAQLLDHISQLEGSLREREEAIQAAYSEKNDLVERLSGLEDDLAARAEALKDREQATMRAQADSSAAVGQLTAMHASLSERQRELEQVAAEKAAVTERLAAVEEDLRVRLDEVGQSQAEKVELAGQVATLESNLRQRQEEIEQAWKRTEELTAELDQRRDEIVHLNDERATLESRLAEAGGWVFGLAGERHSLEMELASVRAKLAQAEIAVSRLEPMVAQAGQEADDWRRASMAIKTGVRQLQQLSTAPDALSVEAERLYHEWRDSGHVLENAAEVISSVARSAAVLATQKRTLHENIEGLIVRLQEQEHNLAAREHNLAAREHNLAAQEHNLAAQEHNLAAQEHNLAAREHGLVEREHGIDADRERALTVNSENLTKIAQLQEKLERVLSEQRQQSRALDTLENRAARKEDELKWLRRFYQLVEGNDTGLKGILPPPVKKRRLVKLVERNGMFDSDAYLRRYPDVAASRMDPLRHYLLHGMSEGRQI